MGLENRIEALKDRHHELDAALEQEATRACRDEQHIHALKKQKLRIKDELTVIA